MNIIINKLFFVGMIFFSVAMFAIETYEECVQQLKKLHEHSEYLTDIKVYIVDNCEKFTSDERETLKSVIKSQRERVGDRLCKKLPLIVGKSILVSITASIACGIAALYLSKGDDQFGSFCCSLAGTFGFMVSFMLDFAEAQNIDNLLRSF